MPGADPGSGLYLVLSPNPPIFYVKHWMNDQLLFPNSLDMLFEYLDKRRAYFLYNWGWNIDDPARVDLARHFERRHQKRYPGHKFVHLCNSISQRDVFLEKGLQAVLCNHNAFVDENIFRPLSDVERTFDAVYSARFSAYKRHHLALSVPNLGLIYPVVKGVDTETAIEEARSQFAHAHFFNHEPDPSLHPSEHSSVHASEPSVDPSEQRSVDPSEIQPQRAQYPAEYRYLRPEQINAYLNKCRVGLCLSVVEGGMNASIEYLLSGLPIVSTKSKGGRDEFFDDSYALIVEDLAEAVRDGVAEMIRREIAPEFVREKALEKVRVHRQTFFNVIEDIYKSEGVTRDFAEEWPLIYTNKLYKRLQHKDTIAALEAAL